MFTLRWGIVGTGRIAGQFVADISIDPKVRNNEKIDHALAVVGSRSKEKAELFLKNNAPQGAHAQIQKLYSTPPQAAGSYEEVYGHPDVDIVYIAVPHPNHFPCAKAALEAGKGILVEKPATLTAAESQILIDLAESKGLFFMEGVWTRFLPLAARFQELIHVEKAIGDIHHVFVDFGLAFYHLLPPQARHFNAQLAGGAQLDVGPYAILWALLSLYEHPENGREPPSKISCSSLPDPRTGVDLFSTLTIDFQKILARAECASNFMVPSAADSPVKVIGTKGEIHVQRSPARPEKLVIRKYQSKGPIVAVEAYEETQECYPVPGIGLGFEADAVAEAVAGKRLFCQKCPPEATLVTMKILDEWRKQTGYTYPPGLVNVE